jgi:hypothetical protein
MSRSISPDYSPASRTSKNLSFYVPVRSSFKSENAKPTLSTAKHLDLQSKRKKLMKESKILEEKVKEIKKKVQLEVNVARGKTGRFSQGKGKIMEKVLLGLQKNRKKKIFHDFKVFNDKLKEKQEEKLSQFKEKTLKKVFLCIKQMCWERILKTREKIEISKRHYHLQLLLKTFFSWQEHVSIETRENNSYLEEMDSLIDSFIQDSFTLN